MYFHYSKKGISSEKKRTQLIFINQIAFNVVNIVPTICKFHSSLNTFFLRECQPLHPGLKVFFFFFFSFFYFGCKFLEIESLFLLVKSIVITAQENFGIQTVFRKFFGEQYARQTIQLVGLILELEFAKLEFQPKI